MGVTRERIRQIEAKALKKLQHKKRKDQLLDFCKPLLRREIAFRNYFSFRDLQFTEKFLHIFPSLAPREENRRYLKLIFQGCILVETGDDV